MEKNEPAFPLTEDAINFKNRDYPMQGLTKLEWFAGMALIGLNFNENLASLGTDKLASWAFNQAEAMLAEAERRSK